MTGSPLVQFKVTVHAKWLTKLPVTGKDYTTFLLYTASFIRAILLSFLHVIKFVDKGLYLLQVLIEVQLVQG